MKLADVKVGMRVACYRPNRVRNGTVLRVRHGAVYVAIDMDLEAERAFVCDQLQPLEPEPRPVTATEVNVMAEAERARLQMLQEGNDRYWQRAIGSWTEPPLLTPVPTTVEELVQSAEMSGLEALQQGSGFPNEPVHAVPHPMDARHLNGNGSNLLVARSYVSEYLAHLERYGLIDAAEEPIPPKAVAKPLAIGTPPRKLCLPEKP